VKKLLLSFVGLTAAFSIANAGHFTLVSSSLDTYVPASAWTNETTSSSYSVSGKTFSLSLSAVHSAVYSGAVGGGTSAQVYVHVKILWHPDPGDPTPSSAAATWSMTQSADAALIKSPFRIGGTSAVTIGGSFNPDPNFYSFNQVFIWSTSPLHEASSTANSTLGGFSFHAEGSDWVGEGGFDIPLAIFASGTITGMDQGAIDASLSQSNTLVSVGGYPVS